MFLLLLLAAVGAVIWIRAEGGEPRTEAPTALVVGGSPQTLELAISDDGAGLRDVRVVLAHADGEEVLLEQGFPGNLLTGGGLEQERLAVDLDAKALRLPQGDALLRVVVHDWSWRGGFGGNEGALEIPVRIDLAPPRIEVASGLTYVRRGGAGAVSYSVSEETGRDGVMVGDQFYRGFRVAHQGNGHGSAGGKRIAIFAIAADAPAEPDIRVVAEDAAGNRGGAPWPVVVQSRRMRDGNVTLPRSFLEQKVLPIAQAERIQTEDLNAAFHTINTELRAANEAKIREALFDSADESLWVGAFEQLPNSKVTSLFAERRLYFVGGKRVSEATHYGYDLASRSAAPVTAANGGRVVFAENLGIYGNCVLIDHGLGLGSLYGHLSRIDVSPGDTVEKGQTLGLSGATGLAGGDHLHFAMLVGDTYVDPLEWWDPAWVRTHIDTHVASATP